MEKGEAQSSITVESVKKTKKSRPKTKAIRVELKNKIETALLLKKSPILHLFKKACGTDLAAPLDDVLVVLGYDQNGPIKKLTKYQLRSLSNKSRVFNIIGTDDDPLQLVFDSRTREDLEDKTVYVDNIPLSCSADQLRRRASVYGNVVHVHMPVVNRLRRRHCVGVEAPLNSGVAFLQFSSKTASRRFCKRYAANCHLNRTHHTHRKRKSHLSTSALTIQAPPTTAEVDQNKPNNSQPSSQNRPSTSNDNQQERRKRRSTEVSVSGMDSGTESDFAKPNLKRLKLEEAQTDKQPKKVKRKRRKPNKTVLISAFSLTKFLSKIQVFPYNKYKDLRREYIQMKTTKLKTLKNDLRERDLIHTESDIENIDFASRGNQQRRRKRQRSRRQADTAGSSASSLKKKKHRSRATILKVATRLKDESFAIPYIVENPY